VGNDPVNALMKQMLRLRLQPKLKPWNPNSHSWNRETFGNPVHWENQEPGIHKDTALDSPGGNPSKGVAHEGGNPSS
jgi:hypothetical protein